MRTEPVVVVPPRLDDFPRLRQGGEHVLVEALVAQPAVEALDERVLHRLARLDVMPADAVGRPPEHCHAGEFGSAVRGEAVMADD